MKYIKKALTARIKKSSNSKRCCRNLPTLSIIFSFLLKVFYCQRGNVRAAEILICRKLGQGKHLFHYLFKRLSVIACLFHYGASRVFAVHECLGSIEEERGRHNHTTPRSLYFPFRDMSHFAAFRHDQMLFRFLSCFFLNLLVLYPMNLTLILIELELESTFDLENKVINLPEGYRMMLIWKWVVLLYIM